MSTEEILRQKIRRGPKVAFRTSRDAFRTRKDEKNDEKGGIFDRENGFKGKLERRVNFRGTQLGEERSGEKIHERGKFRSFDSNGRKKRVYANERMNENDGICDRENGFKGKLEKRVNFRGTQLGEERSGEKFHERGKFRNFDSNGRKKKVYANERMDENDGICDRENGFKGKLEKRVNFRRTQLGEERSGEKFHERGRFRNFDSSGRKKSVYANERMNENESEKKTLFKKREKEVKDEVAKGKAKTNERTMWVPGKSRNVSSNSKEKIYTRGVKEKKENDVLATAKWKTKGKERGRMGFIGTDDHGSGFVKKKCREDKFEFNKGESQEEEARGSDSVKKKNREDQFEFSKRKRQDDEAHGSGSVKKNREDKFELSNGKSQEVVAPSSSDKRNVRDEVGLDDDAERSHDRRKKKKWLIKLDPYDISNKRLDDAIGIDGSTEEKKKDSEKEAKISKNAEFRAIQPSPSILSFVEKNLLGRRRMIDIKRAGYNIDLSAPLDNIPFSTSTERENIEENIFRNRLEFFAAAKVSSSFPPPNLPEIAFAGRSNVGKSSLLNALTRQWGVVRTSDKPGLTQTINFFNLGTKLCLVDLPGYGFAYAKEEVKEAWEDLVKEYVSTRAGLKRVCLLIDTKWGMKPRDIELIDLMERSKTKYQIVLTKTDTVFPIDVARRAMQIEESLLPNKSVVQPLMMASSKSGAGIRSLRTVLANIARFVKI